MARRCLGAMALTACAVSLARLFFALDSPWDPLGPEIERGQVAADQLGATPTMRSSAVALPKQALAPSLTQSEALTSSTFAPSSRPSRSDHAVAASSNQSALVRFNNLQDTVNLAKLVPHTRGKHNGTGDPNVVVISTLHIHDGFCNKLLQIMGYWSFLKMQNPNVKLIVAGGSTAIFERQIDLEHLNRFTNSSLIFSPIRGIEPDFIPSPNSLWCTFRPSFSVIRYGLRPSRDLRLKAETVISDLKKRGARKVLAVHGRSFEHEGCEGHSLKSIVQLCHISNTRFRQQGVLCNYTMDQARLLASSEWPNENFSASAPVGYYLSHDSFSGKDLQGVKQRSMRHTYTCKACLQSNQSTPMIMDMWTSAQADYYLANPLSSCEPIIAQWRLELHGKDHLNQYPRGCYGGFAKPQSSDMASMCTHTNLVTLSLPSFGLCNQILVLASALEKVANGGVFLAWGPWRKLLTTEINFALLESQLPRAEFILSTHDQFVFEHTNGSHAIDFKPRRIDSDEELTRALLAPDLPFLRALVPVRQNNNSAAPDCPRWKEAINQDL